MPNIGPLELAVVVIIALVVFGPKRLPELGRSMGRGIREFRSTISDRHGEEGTAELEDGSPTGEPVDGEIVGAHRP
jgi:sec-independent protein translocase protein TatA